MATEGLSYFEHLLQIVDSLYTMSRRLVKNEDIEWQMDNALNQIGDMIRYNRRWFKCGEVTRHNIGSLEHHKALKLACDLQFITLQPASTDAEIEHARSKLCEQLRVMTQHNRRAFFRSIPYNQVEIPKVVSKKKLEEIVDCPICQESPKMKDCILTECGHYFCRGCWTDWMNTPTSSKDCPYCRTIMPQITGFKSRCYKPRTSSKSTGKSVEPIIVID
jgi:hypothetical protein